MVFILLLAMIFLFPACGKEAAGPQEYLYNFADSVTLIRELIKSDSLPKILEDADQDGLERLITNFSPAQMALESEVLNCTLPVLIYFYKDSCADRALLEQLAREYDDKLKFIIIDADAFFSIAEQFEIESYPALIGMSKRNEVYHDEGGQTIENISLAIAQTLLEATSNLI